MTNNKCVYLHKLDGVVVYVGSGTISRSNRNSCRSKEHRELWDYLEKEIYASGLSTDEAITLEQSLIDIYWASGRLLNKRKIVGKVKELNHEALSKFLYYSEESETSLKWKIANSNRVQKDSKAGSRTSHGYFQIRINDQEFLVHRVVYCLYHKVNLSIDLVIDHIDGDGLNNKISNLRAVSQSENCKNKIKNNLPSNTNEQCINERIDKQSFRVSWTQDGIRKYKNFSYNKSPNAIKTRNWFHSRDQAFKAAIVFRDELISKGFIVPFKPVSV